MIQTIPQAKIIRYMPGTAFLPEGGRPVRLRMETEDPRIARLAAQVFPDSPIITEIEAGCGGFGLYAGPSGVPEIPFSLAVPAGSEEEGYRLYMGSEALSIEADRAAGLFYGLQTLRQVRDTCGAVPAAELADWPDTATRSMNLDLRQTFSRPEKLVEYMAEFAKYKINAVLIEYEDKFPFERNSLFRHPRFALSRDQLEALKEAAAEHFIEIIPLQQTFGHLEYVLRHGEYKKLRETEESTGELCPSNPESYRLVAGLLEEVMEAHPDSAYIHLGCDEVYSLCECSVCRERYGGSKGAAFISFVNRLVPFCLEKGKVPIIWHDMLDKCTDEELALLDNRVQVMIWLYNGRNIGAEVAALAGKLRLLGIGIMGAPAVRSFDWKEHQNYPVIANRTDNLLQWRDIAGETGIDCMVATNWTGPFSLGVPYGVFETTWYPMVLFADLTWNRQADTASFPDRFLRVFHGIDPADAHGRLGRYLLEDYYDIIWKLTDLCTRNKDIAELIAVMHDFEVATDKSRAIHKYLYRWELFPGDEAEWRSLLNNYRRNTDGLARARPRMTELLLRYQPEEMVRHYVLSRFYIHDYLEEGIYRQIGLTDGVMKPVSG